jgi:hypothetical protein
VPARNHQAPCERIINCVLASCRGYLGTNEIEDKDAIREALYKHLDHTLDVP